MAEGSKLDAKVVELHHEGLGRGQIGKRLGLRDTEVSRILISQGVDRPKHRTSRNLQGGDLANPKRADEPHDLVFHADSFVVRPTKPRKLDDMTPLERISASVSHGEHPRISVRREDARALVQGAERARLSEANVEALRGRAESAEAALNAHQNEVHVAPQPITEELSSAHRPVRLETVFTMDGSRQVDPAVRVHCDALEASRDRWIELNAEAKKAHTLTTETLTDRILHWRRLAIVWGVTACACTPLAAVAGFCLGHGFLIGHH